MANAVSWVVIVLEAVQILCDVVYGENIHTHLSPSAFFVFGDSLSDVGNNNYINSIAKANMHPYGIDYPMGPNGRFCNGLIIVDFIAQNLSLPSPPPYLAPSTRGEAILKGVNYASGSSGILRFTGVNFVGRVDLDTQLLWFNNTISELDELLGSNGREKLLASSLFTVTSGSNDYINNYLLKASPSQSLYTPSQYQHLLLTKFSKQLMRLYELGARNVVVYSLGPLGCIPSQLVAQGSVNGECSNFVNKLVLDYNEGLSSLISNLNSHLPFNAFQFIDIYHEVIEYRDNPSKYGFKYNAKACCGAGRFNGEVLCLPILKPCSNRDDYVFWDDFHPTEKTYRILSKYILSKLIF